MSTVTTNFDLIKSGVNDPTDQDLWGGYLNQNFDVIDNVMKGWRYQSITTDYVVVDSDAMKYFACDATGGSLQVTLVDPTTVPAGWTISVKRVNSGSNTVTIIGTIDGATNMVLTTQYTSVELVSTGSAWFTLSKSEPNFVKTGTIMMFGSSTPPSGFLACNFAAVSRTVEADLFSVIGTSFGSGDGTTTFNLPPYNLGYFVRGISPNSTIDPSGPRAVGTIQQDAFQGHAHGTGANLGANLGNFNIVGVNNLLNGNFPTTAPITDGTNGTPRIASETRPKNVATFFMIKT